MREVEHDPNKWKDLENSWTGMQNIVMIENFPQIDLRDRDLP